MSEYGGVEFVIVIPSKNVKIELAAYWNTTIGQAREWVHSAVKREAVGYSETLAPLYRITRCRTHKKVIFTLTALKTPMYRPLCM
jgi:hypothetical protein